MCTLLVAAHFLPTASAHSGTTHAGTPHWVLLAFVLFGGSLIGASIGLVRRGHVAGRAGLGGLFVGFVVGGFGAVGLVEIQVVSTVGPQFGELYPFVSLVVGVTVLVGSLLAGLRYWPTRPRYTFLGVVLGAWILYPSVMPNEGLTHPAGYLVVLALPAVVGYVLRSDASHLVGRVVGDRYLRTVWAVSTLLVVLFLSFSAGTLTINPAWGPTPPSSSFVTAIPVADPLVYWPALEFVYPSVPLAGMVSVGTVVLFGTLASIVGLNVAAVADQWRTRTADFSAMSMAGLVSTTGATACCCCAPAMYGVLSALVGAAASPVYWAFMDTSSPVGALFLALSISFLLGSLVRTPSATSAACDVNPQSA